MHACITNRSKIGSEIRNNFISFSENPTIFYLRFQINPNRNSEMYLRNFLKKTNI